MSLIAAGMGIAVTALMARVGIKAWRASQGGVAGAAGKYLRGGFEPNMSKREALQILGLRDGASREKLRDAHRAALIKNHPDKGGSPYLAAKINEAKDLLEKGSSSS